MNFFAVLTFISFLLFLQAGVFILIKNHRLLINRLFALLSSLFAIYAISVYAFFQTTNVEKIYFYDRFASIGWIFFPLVAVWFYVIFSKNKSSYVRYIIHFFLTPVALFTFYKVLTDLESVKFFYYQDGVWFYTLYDYTISYILYVSYVVVCILIVYYVLIGWYYNYEKKREKMQSVVLLVSVSAFFVFSFLTSIVFPLFQSDVLPSLASINGLLLIGGGLVGILLEPRQLVSPAMIHNLVMSHVKEFIFFLDKDGRIKSTNQYTLQNLKYNIYDITKNNPDHIIFGYNKGISLLNKMQNRSISSQLRMDLITRDNQRIPVIMTAMKVTDDFQRKLGYAIVFLDYRQKLKLKEEVAERVRTEKNLYQIRKELEMLVKKRTFELQEANQRLENEVVERKRVEQQIKSDLQEKVELVKEVHHRVKNNIQMIISLANMLCSHPKIDSSSSEKLRELAERIRYISKIHEDFYASPNLSKIAFSPYLKKSVGELYGNFGRGVEIVFKLNLTDEFLEINQAIPLGIIFNELLINAMKLAYEIKNENKQKYVINVEFLKRNGKIFLIVKDNGLGLDSKEKYLKTGSIGLKLVNVLVKEHLRGTLEDSHGSNYGINYRVSFDEFRNN